MGSKMTSKQSSHPDWPVLFTIVSSALLLLMLLGIIKVFILDSHGIVDTTTEQALFFGGLFLALPCGLLSLISAIKARLKRAANIVGIVTGILCISIGLLAWAWFFMISAFSAAF